MAFLKSILVGLAAAALSVMLMAVTVIAVPVMFPRTGGAKSSGLGVIAGALPDFPLLIVGTTMFAAGFI
ncbi:MAG: hypothetical protein ABI833_18665, partial [Acidobacteriota bacterium]